ncbi:MAG: hypothetical protein K2P99_04110 [Burkholderiales bacterium]|nr:hypothetical protein [Burkholderiales bacterium]
MIGNDKLKIFALLISSALILFSILLDATVKENFGLIIRSVLFGIVIQTLLHRLDGQYKK